MASDIKNFKKETDPFHECLTTSKAASGLKIPALSGSLMPTEVYFILITFTIVFQHTKQLLKPKPFNLFM